MRLLRSQRPLAYRPEAAPRTVLVARMLQRDHALPPNQLPPCFPADNPLTILTKSGLGVCRGGNDRGWETCQ